ncbi:hypothetical protein B0T22DRAFT_32849 [Podospora appendiculata]|uniref:Uncharacterized protein n=1 Tax=Podospora appendiculata TaxID=314037 RepID=A0AAE0XGU0_9PEZI|nr:hypothetical protein B0T22DRAFT_32849 [Podospora appendiculata]
MIQRALWWIGTASPPLTIPQICEAVSFNDAQAWMDPNDVIEESDILRCCSSLIRKTHDNQSFEFAHFTVHQYLESINRDSPLTTFDSHKEHLHSLWQRGPCNFCCCHSLTYILSQRCQSLIAWTRETPVIPFTRMLHRTSSNMPTRAWIIDSTCFDREIVQSRTNWQLSFVGRVHLRSPKPR